MLLGVYKFSKTTTRTCLHGPRHVDGTVPVNIGAMPVSCGADVGDLLVVSVPAGEMPNAQCSGSAGRKCGTTLVRILSS